MTGTVLQANAIYLISADIRLRYHRYLLHLAWCELCETSSPDFAPPPETPLLPAPLIIKGRWLCTSLV